MHYDLLALGAAACWAITSIISTEPSRQLGALAFTRWRMLLVLGLLLPVTLLTQGWGGLSTQDLATLALSGLVGIFIGDSALFAAMNRLGPRRTGVLFATHALFGALLGYLVLDEHIGAQALVGGLLVVGGVMIATLMGRHREESHAWEADRGHRGLGVALGLLAALCQALGTLLAKPVMAQGADPVTATAVRVAATTVAQFALLGAGFAPARALCRMSGGLLLQVGMTGLIGMGLGMSLIMLALRYGDVGMVGILSSVTPVLVLPVLWWRLGRSPAAGAWVGAVTTVAGTALVLLR